MGFSFVFMEHTFSVHQRLCFLGLQTVRVNKLSTPSPCPKMGTPVGIGLVAATFCQQYLGWYFSSLELEQVTLRVLQAQDLYTNHDKAEEKSSVQP